HASAHSKLAGFCYELAARYDPDHWEWRYGRVLLDTELGDTTKTLQGFNNFVRIKDDHALAWLRFGEAHYNARNDEEAKDAFLRAEELALSHWPIIGPREPFYPLIAYVRFAQARLSFRQGDHALVESILQKVIEESPRFGPAHRLLGRALQQLGQPDKARKHLDLALQCGPYTPPVDPFIDALTMDSRSDSFLLKEAGVAFNKGDVEWAERVLRRALEFYPDSEDVLGELALLLVRLRRFDDASPFLVAYLALPPTHYATPSKIGAELVRLGGDIEQAITCYRLALELQPIEPTNHLNLGMALAIAGLYQEAESLFLRTIELEPSNHFAHLNLAQLFIDTDRSESAIAELTLAVGLKPDDMNGWVKLGRLQESLNQAGAALDAYRQGLEREADHVDLLEAIAMLLAQEGRIEAAYRHAHHLVEVAINSPRGPYTLARVAMLAGDADEAREACLKALKIDPSFDPAQRLLNAISPR
ncbi:MAG: tetratricopeptide repeat protein, partial [Planctomycetota bacterium]|nr:tetratricopeptide repeat protein [Planctomycetota bacterium]